MNVVGCNVVMSNEWWW